MRNLYMAEISTPQPHHIKRFIERTVAKKI